MPPAQSLNSACISRLQYIPGSFLLNLHAIFSKNVCCQDAHVQGSLTSVRKRECRYVYVPDAFIAAQHDAAYTFFSVNGYLDLATATAMQVTPSTTSLACVLVFCIKSHDMFTFSRERACVLKTARFNKTAKIDRNRQYFCLRSNRLSR